MTWKASSIVRIRAGVALLALPLAVGACSEATDDHGVSAGDTSSTQAIPPRLTPLPIDLPKFPPNAQLEAAAAKVPLEERIQVGEGKWAKVEPAGAFPVFHDETNTLAGIHVSGLGIVTRERYEDPTFDPEVFLLEVLGEQEYLFRLNRSTQTITPQD